MTLEQRLVDYVSSVTYGDLPSEVVLAAKKSFVDVLGVSIGGSGAVVVKEIARLVKGSGGKAESTVFLHDASAPAYEAVFVNSTMARVLDFDEYHMSTGTHPTPTMVPVALATGELEGKVSGKELIAAMVTGAEIMCRMRRVPDYCVGMSGWVGDICGVFGSAVTAGKIMKLGGEEMLNALGIAYSQASGNAQAVHDGVMTASLQQGFSARSGLLSAILARRGITGAHHFLEGRSNFYAVYYRGIPYDLGRLMGGIGEEYDILNLATKLYPSTGFTNGPIENVIDIMGKNRLSSQDVETVVLHIGQRMYNNTCQPRELKYRPSVGTDGIFSLPYTVGSAVYRGDVFLDDFSDEAIKDESRLNEVDKVEIILDDDIEEEVKRLNLPLSLHVAEIRTTRGKTFTQKMRHAKGFPQNPMTFEECAEKAKRCARFAIKEFPEERVSCLVDMINNLEEIDDVRSVIELLA